MGKNRKRDQKNCFSHRSPRTYLWSHNYKHWSWLQLEESLHTLHTIAILKQHGSFYIQLTFNLNIIYKSIKHLLNYHSKVWISSRWNPCSYELAMLNSFFIFNRTQTAAVYREAFDLIWSWCDLQLSGCVARKASVSSSQQSMKEACHTWR